MTTLPIKYDMEINKGLKRIILLRFMISLIIFSFFPFVLIAYLLQPPNWILTSFGVVFCVSFVVIGLVHGFSRCPACHKWFNVGSYSNHFTSKCMNCGLKLRQ